MKVVYKKSITEQIQLAIAVASTNNKEIEFIELSTKEFDNLIREDADRVPPIGWHPTPPPLCYYMQMRNGLREVPYMGVTVKEVKELE